MESRVYTVLDRVAEDGGPPWLAKNDGVAVRQFYKLLERTDPHNLSDYLLVCLGVYESSSMALRPFERPEEIPTVRLANPSIAKEGGKE